MQSAHTSTHDLNLLYAEWQELSAPIFWADLRNRGCFECGRDEFNKQPLAVLYLCVTFRALRLLAVAGSSA